MVHQLIVIFHQSMVTVPPSVVMVQHKPQSMLWTPQTQYIPTILIQPYVGKIHEPLVDINSPLIGG